jgi:hypothetical protein
MYLVRIYLTFLLHVYRTSRPGGITTVQLRSKLPHILRIICTVHAYKLLQTAMYPENLLDFVGLSVLQFLETLHAATASHPKCYVWYR